MSDITVGSVAVDIVPDTRGFAEKLKAKLAGLSAEIGLSVDSSGVRAQLEELTRPRSATINANADTAEAELRLDELARDRTVNVDVDRAGSVGRAAGGMSLLLAGALALGPALVPIAAAVAGLGLALGAPLAAAGGGLTIFGLIGGAAISQTQKTAKKIAELKKRADTLVDPKAKASAAAQAKALEATLTGPQRAFLKAKETVGAAFGTLLKGSTGRDIFRPINAGLRLLAAIMPALAPVIHSVSVALTGMLKSIGDSAKGGALKSFLDFLGRASGPTLTSFAVVLGNIATGFTGLFAAFAPVGGSLTGKLLELSGAFADFGRNAGSNKGLQSFIAYVQKSGPQVAAVLGAVVGAIVHVAVALAPLGGLALATIGVLAHAISAIPTPVLGALVSAITAIVVAVKIWTIAQGILDAVLSANPISLIVLAIAGLVAGLIYAYKTSDTFRAIVDAAFRGVAKAIDFVKDHWKLLITLILGPFGAAIVFIVDHFETVKSVARTVFKFVVDQFFTVVGALIHGAAKAFGWVKGIGPKLKAAAAEFDKFRDSVNAALDGIDPLKVIHLDVKVGRNTNATIGEAAASTVPGKASGGHVTAGRLYKVGEVGMELFRAPSDGEIIPNHKMDEALGGSTGPQFNVEKVVAQDVNDFLRQMQTRSRAAATSGVRR